MSPLRHLEPVPALPLSLPLGAGLVWAFDIAGLRTAVLERFGRRGVVPAE